MSCPHAHTTTVAWMYGEADEAHALHVGGCAECAAVADAHLDVLDAVAPVLPALRGAPQAVAPRLGARSKAALTVAALALIAAAAALVLGAPAAPVPAPDTSSVALLAPDDLDARLDDVHDDVVAASLDVGPL